MRRVGLPLACCVMGACLAAGAGEASAQHSTTAQVSVTIVRPAVSYATVDSTVTRVAADSIPSGTRWLPSGARLDWADRPEPPARPAARRPDGPRIRWLRLDYTAN